MKNILKFLSIVVFAVFFLFMTTCEDPDKEKSSASYNGVTWTNADLGVSSFQKTANNDGYDVEMWNENRQGTASMTLGSGGAYKCSWSGINNVLFRAGRKYNETQTHSQIGTISIEYKADKFELPGASGTKNAYLSCYGWISNGAGSDTTNLVEYYIIDNYGEYNPGTDGGTPKNSATIDGATYNFYEKSRTGPSIKGNTTFTQYFSIRQTKRTEGTISVSQHFNAWNTNGMTKVNGKMYEVAFKVESYGGASGKAEGNAEISKNILKINGTPIQ
jgi:endo-1,4-beta-xylanase